MSLDTLARSSFLVPCSSVFLERFIKRKPPLRKIPEGFPPARQAVQVERYVSPVKAMKSTSAYPSAVPRRKTERLSLWAIVLLRTSASSTFDSLALVIRGVESNSARHKASSKVDLPEPVLPVMAKMPAFFNGSTVKSTSNSPAKEARFFPRIANIFIMNCCLNYSLPASLMTSCNNSFIAAGISCSSYFLL